MIFEPAICGCCGGALGDINAYCETCWGGSSADRAREAAEREEYDRAMRELYEEQMREQYDQYEENE